MNPEKEISMESDYSEREKWIERETTNGYNYWRTKIEGEVGRYAIIYRPKTPYLVKQIIL